MSGQNRNSTSNVEAFSVVGGNSSLKARLLGSGCAGVFELAMFHPVDTVAKRLMSNQKSYTLSVGNVNAIIFQEHANAGIFNKWKSLFPGIGFAAGYKILQRTYKFGGQPYMKEYVNNQCGKQMKETFGPTTGKTVTSAIAGSLMGIGEVALLPLDVLKIKSQTNPEVLKGRGVVEIFMKEGRGLYRGATWTAARNAPGSFALFGGSAFIHHSVFGLDKTTDATFLQNFAASISGAIASITVAAPLDVIKTRIQNKPFDAPESGVQIVRNLIRKEGFGAFFKGLTPKIIVVGPKLIFSFTIAQTMIAYFEKTL
mmetsp:Transcript_14370/g.17753  ORF Transcript_14370/g.17753 Transcript_14370/m.17753 type:complete len:313 (+) Transcript_14370:382-1320(+)|eukprot:CAMPEP_0204822436 /NCGR_PEP_ID=MMETSP1346-20131115/619_1 /ASSEMBLY_ACC=CAM_ASM_000771 /TAXON_ID=215587 /ORGANISM="Aplanochytrium stocchinoi, Strain GSBS06" /LENGTH=312 /DNA_ID=CAMNT_0051948639 /DNA_START=287 /DNA_END=1225 /DNA_ORIENTATION=+